MEYADLLKMGKWDYDQFITTLRGNPARVSKLFDEDPPIRPMVMVPREEIVDAFIRRNPKYSDLRAELLKVRDYSDKIQVVEEEWEKVKG